VQTSRDGARELGEVDSLTKNKNNFYDEIYFQNKLVRLRANFILKDFEFSRLSRIYQKQKMSELTARLKKVVGINRRQL
jgi:hypothetical protein